MDFDRLLRAFDEDTGQKEEVALAIYYLEEEEGESGVRQTDVKTVLDESRSTVSTSGMSSYFSRLTNQGWLTADGNGGKRLTHTGVGEVKTLVDDEVLGASRGEDERFIDTEAIDDERYVQLIEDINASYRHRIYDGTMVLSRKLFEDMTYQILQTHYGGEDVQMFYDQENDCHYSFNDLLNNLKEGNTELRRHSRELDDALVEGLRNLKNAGNNGAHGIRVDFSDDDVDQWSERATYFAEVLYDVLQGARGAQESSD